MGLQPPGGHGLSAGGTEAPWGSPPSSQCSIPHPRPVGQLWLRSSFYTGVPRRWARCPTQGLQSPSAAGRLWLRARSCALREERSSALWAGLSPHSLTRDVGPLLSPALPPFYPHREGSTSHLPPPPIYPHGCSAVFPTNTRLSARSRGELPSRYLTAPPQRGGGGAHSAQGTDERPPLSHPPTSPHKQTTRRAGRENGRESYFFSYWLNCPSILSAPPLAARSALPIGLPSRHSGGSAGHAFRPPHPAFSLCVPCAKEKQPLNGPRGGASAAANKRRGDWRQRGVQISTGRSDWLGVAAAGRAPSSRSGGYCLAAPEAVRAADSGTGARAAAAPW